MPTRRCGSVRTTPFPHGQYCISPRLIAFGILQDYEEALVWTERAEAAAPEMPLWEFVRSALLALAGKEADARAAMQRYLANDNAPFRTMSQWHAQLEDRCRPIIRVFLYGRKNSTRASEKPDCRSDQRGCPRRRGDRKSGSLHVSYGSVKPGLPPWGRTSASAECRHWSGRAVRLVKLRNPA